MSEKNKFKEGRFPTLKKVRAGLVPCPRSKLATTEGGTGNCSKLRVSNDLFVVDVNFQGTSFDGLFVCPASCSARVSQLEGKRKTVSGLEIITYTSVV